MWRAPLPVLLSALALGCAGEEAGEPGPPARPDQLVLRVDDLARGYEYGADSVCGVASAEEGEWPELQPL